MLTVEQLGEGARAALWTLGRLRELQDAGFVDRSAPLAITPAGVSLYDQLAATGYAATPADVRQFIHLTDGTPVDEVDDTLVELVCRWRPDPARE